MIITNKIQKAYNIIQTCYFDNTNNDNYEKSFNTFYQGITNNLSFNDFLNACKLFKSPKPNEKTYFECGVIDNFMVQYDYDMISYKQILGAMVHFAIDIKSLIWYVHNIKQFYDMY